MTDPQASNNDFWRRAFLANHQAAPGLSRQKNDVTAQRPTEFGAKGDLWLQRLFKGVPIDANPGDKMTVMKDGVVVHEIPLIQMGQETVIGRHPSADLQLEFINSPCIMWLFSSAAGNSMSRDSTWRTAPYWTARR